MRDRREPRRRREPLVVPDRAASMERTFYVSADAFYNNSETSGTLKDTPFVDPSVPACS